MYGVSLRCRPGHARIFLEGRRGEKDLHEMSRNRPDRQLRKARRLHVETGLHPESKTMLDGFQRVDRGGIVPTGFLHYLLPSRLVDDAAANGVPIQCEIGQSASMPFWFPTTDKSPGGIIGDRAEDRGMYQFVNDTGPVCALCAQLLANENDVQRRADTDQTR